MKSNLLFIFAIFLSCTLFGQVNFNISGSVTTPDGMGVANQEVFISSLFSDSTFLFLNTSTDAEGHFQESTTAQTTDQQGLISFQIMNCNGNILTTATSWSLSPNQIEVIIANDIVYCDGINSDSCNIVIVEGIIAAPIGSLTAVDNNFPPNQNITYLWNTGEIEQTIIPLNDGIYCVTATFSSGCVAEACYNYVTIDTSDFCFGFISYSLNPTDPVPPLFDLNITMLSGNAPYTYVWNTGDSTNIIEGVVAGEYCVTVTDASLCTFVECIEVSDINDTCTVFIVEELTAAGSSLQATAFHPSGFGVAAYLWSTGDTSDIIFPVETGQYCVTATIVNCVATACYVFTNDTTGFCFGFISYNENPNDSINAESFTVEVNLVGGTAPYIYLWDNGATTQTITTGPGFYCVTVTDASGCSFTACEQVETFEFCEVFIGCDPPGSFQAFGFGQEPFQYLWSTGDTTMALFPTEEGEYCVTVTDASGCVVSSCAYYDPNPNIDSCFAFIILGQDSLGPIFNADTVLLTAFSFGTAPYTYSWSTGEITESIFATSPNLDYCVTVTDSDSCIAVACTNVFNDFCEVGIEVNYNDNGGATLTINSFNSGSIIDIMWSNGEIGESIAVMQTGSYCANVIFDNGCVAEACAFVDLGIFTDSCSVYINVETTGSGGEYLLTAMNGVDFGIYSFEWSTGDTTSSIIVNGGGEYCVTLTNYDNNSICTATACAYTFPTIDSLYSSIIGNVYADIEPIFAGQVLAYRLGFNANGNEIYTVYDSTDLVSNSYEFDSLPLGLYLFKVVLDPNTNFADMFFPTYHYSSATWQGADPVFVPKIDNSLTDIFLISTDTTSGGGIISGNLIDANGLIAQSGDVQRSGGGLANIEIILEHQSVGLFKYTMTDNNGSFIFENLPWGTYKITFDYPGVESPEVWVTLSPNNISHTGVTLNTNLNSVGVEEEKLAAISIYPNPTTDLINIDFGDISGTGNMRIVSTTGKEIENEKFDIQPGELLRVDLSGKAIGMYIVQINTELGQLTKLIMLQ